MRTKSLIIVSLILLIIGSSTILAQEKGAKEAKPQEGAMLWRAMVGSGFLHEHMNYMMQQMASMIRMMSQMIDSGKMDPKMMKLMGETMGDMSMMMMMMREIPAVEEMMGKRPETAMKDMSKMTKKMSEIMEKMAEMMTQMPQ